MAEGLVHNLALADPSSPTAHLSTPSAPNPEITSCLVLPSLSCSVLPQSLRTFSSFSGMLFPEPALPRQLARPLDPVVDTSHHEPSHTTPPPPPDFGGFPRVPQTPSPHGSTLHAVFSLPDDRPSPSQAGCGLKRSLSSLIKHPTCCSAERENKIAILGFVTAAGREEDGSSVCDLCPPPRRVPRYLARINVDPTFSPCRNLFSTSAQGCCTMRVAQAKKKNPRGQALCLFTQGRWRQIPVSSIFKMHPRSHRFSPPQLPPGPGPAPPDGQPWPPGGGASQTSDGRGFSN